MKKFFALFLAIALSLSVIPFATACCMHTHELILHEELLPTCEENGYEEYYECPDCGTFFSDEKGVNIIKEKVSVKANGHNTKLVEKVEPTCVTNGNEKHYICTVCEKTFADKNATVAKDDYVITANGHNLKAEKSLNDNEHVMKCSCGYTQNAKHNLTVIEENNVGHLYKEECECGYKTLEQTLAVIRITTDNGQEIQGNKDSAEYYSCKVSVTDCEKAYQITNAVAKVKVRGNYTANYSKKPYRIKFDKKQGMLGLNDGLKAKSWVLLAEYKDNSGLRNTVASYLGNEILGNDGYFVTDTRQVVVYLNGNYKGLYVLAEQQQVNKGRVDIAEPDENYEGTDIGYFVELDAYATEEAELERFVVNYGNPKLKYRDGTSVNNTLQANYSVKNDIYSKAQNEFAKKIVENTFKVAYDAVYGDHSDLSKNPFKTLDEQKNIITDSSIKTAKEAVERVIELKSLVDTYVLNELFMDMDVGWSSFRMSVDMSEKGNKKLAFEAPWDWDSAFGYAMEETNVLLCAYKYNGNSSSGTPKSYTNPWLTLLVNEEWFWNDVYAKWTSVSKSGAFTEIIKQLDARKTLYAKYYEENFKKWPISGDNGGYGAYKQVKSYSEGIDFLKNWLTARISFLETAFKNHGVIKTTAL